MRPAVTVLEMKRLIIRALALEDLHPEDLADQAPLFGPGLGLDSVDALELALALGREYGVDPAGLGALQADQASPAALAAWVNTHRQEAP